MLLGLLALALMPLLMMGLGGLFDFDSDEYPTDDADSDDEAAPTGPLPDAASDTRDDGTYTGKKLSDGDHGNTPTSNGIYEFSETTDAVLTDADDEYMEVGDETVLQGTLFVAGGVPEVQSLEEVRSVSALEGDDDLHVEGRAAHLSGGEGDDTLALINASGVVHGDEGDDVVQAEGSFPVALVGGDGNDLVNGGMGDDILFGDRIGETLSEGNDILWAGAGEDVLEGGKGQDSLIGQDGDDVIYSGERQWRDGRLDGTPEGHHDDGQKDTLDGGTGNDRLYFGENDEATGGQGSDDFIVTEVLSTGQNGAVIHDFDPATDQIEIHVYQAKTPAEMQSLQFSVQNNDTVVRYGEHVVLTLLNQSEVTSDMIELFVGSSSA